MLDLDVIIDSASVALAETTAASDVPAMLPSLLAMMPDRTLIGLVSQVFMHLAMIMTRHTVSCQESPKGFVPLCEVRANATLLRGKLICRTAGAVGLLAYIALALSDATRPLDLCDGGIVALFCILILGASGYLERSVHRRIQDRAAADFLRLVALEMEEMAGEKRARASKWDLFRACLGL